MKRLLFCLFVAALPLLCGCGGSVMYIDGTMQEPVTLINQDPGWQYGLVWNNCGDGYLVEALNFRFSVQTPGGNWDDNVEYIQVPGDAETRQRIRLKPNDPRDRLTDWGREPQHYWVRVSSRWSCYIYRLDVDARHGDAFKGYDWDLQVEGECRQRRPLP